jgi:peptidoglycan hydrolase-like protein with peptidoglycan-binding domain
LSSLPNKESVVSQEYSRSQVLDIIEAEALKRHIPKDDFLRFADIETGGHFNPNAHSDRSSAKGLFQFTDATAAAYGLTGRQMDPVANTAAAAQLYLDNRDSLVRNHATTGHPYLSGKATPDGLDMYLAHQQGSAGYRSIQDAIATGKFDRESTRTNIENNVGDDFKKLTGHARSELSGMSDKEMATAFVGYWNAKFDHVQIPEKGVGPAHAQTPVAPQVAPPHVAAPAASAPSQPTTAATARPSAGGPHDITIGDAYALTQKYQNVTHYGLGRKDPDQGSVDCSGWVVKMQNATMEEINQKAGRDVFSEKEMFSKGNDAAATIVEKSAARSGQLLEGKQVTVGALKEGMIIGEDNGPQSFDKGRYKGIDHITMVVRDPKTNELMISQSSSHKGVHLEPVAEYLAYKQSHGVKLYATDPLLKARELMHDSHPTVAPVSEKAARAQSGHILPHAEHGVLKEGNKSEDVGKLQEQLRSLGVKDGQGHSLIPDKEFGPRTTEAVKAFQAAHNLKQDGEVGPQTMKQLQEALKQHSVAEPTPAAKTSSPAEGMIDRMMAAMKNGDNHAVANAAGDAARTATGQEFRGNVTAQVNAQEQHAAAQTQNQQQSQQQDAVQSAQRQGGR